MSRASLRIGWRRTLVIPALVMCTASTWLLIGDQRHVAVAQAPPTVDAFRELMIVHPRVVNPYLNGMRSHNGGPNTAAGPWSFRGLVQDLALQANGGTPPNAAFLNNYLSNFLESWLHDYKLVGGTLQKLTGAYGPGDIDLPARDAGNNGASVTNALLEGRGDGFVTLNTNRTYELWRAPFELIAIVNRLDLWATDGSHAGELRFVFGLKGRSDFTLIIEYKVRTDEWDADKYAREWHKLGTMAAGSEAYLQQLELITNRITKWQPQSSSPALRLAHIRTNEIALAPSGGGWELREFRPNASNLVVPAPTFNSPNHAAFADPALGQFLRCRESELTGANASAFVLPQTFDQSYANTHCSSAALTVASVGMMGTRAVVGNPWLSADLAVSPLARQNFGLLTCNGCHEDHKNVGISGRMRFLHVSPSLERADSSDVQSSDFELMTGRGRLSLFLSRRHASNGSALECPTGAECAELDRRVTQLQTLLGVTSDDACSADANCGTGGFCVLGTCATTPPHCHNWRADIDLGETGPDCGGGECGACAVGLRCHDDSDCQSGATCTSNICTAP